MEKSLTNMVIFQMNITKIIRHGECLNERICYIQINQAESVAENGR